MIMVIMIIIIFNNEMNNNNEIDDALMFCVFYSGLLARIVKILVPLQIFTLVGESFWLTLSLARTPCV